MVDHKGGNTPWINRQLTAGPYVSGWGFPLYKSTFLYVKISGCTWGTVGIGSYNKDNLSAGEPPPGNCALLLQSLLYRVALPSCRFVAAEDCEENYCW